MQGTQTRGALGHALRTYTAVLNASLCWPRIRGRASRRSNPLRHLVRRRAKRAPLRRCVTRFGGERSEPRCVTGNDFDRLVLSYALGFVRVSFPRASSVGFSLCWSSARAELRSAPVDGRACFLCKSGMRALRQSFFLCQTRSRNAPPRCGRIECQL